MAFTFFFRDVQPLKLLCKYISENFRDHKYIHIWSAGCALGQEPYTFAILLRESMGPMIFRNVTIHATDIEKTYGPIIDRGVYEDDSLKRIPKDLFNKYFEPCDNENKYVITDEIKRRIEFKHHDLRDSNKIGDNFAGIICKKNVPLIPSKGWFLSNRANTKNAGKNGQFIQTPFFKHKNIPEIIGDKNKNNQSHKE